MLCLLITGNTARKSLYESSARRSVASLRTVENSAVLTIEASASDRHPRIVVASVPQLIRLFFYFTQYSDAYLSKAPTVTFHAQ